MCNKPVKLFGVSRLALLYDVDKVVCEDERYTFPLNAKFRFKVAQDVAKIYVKKLNRQESKLMSGSGNR